MSRRRARASGALILILLWLRAPAPGIAQRESLSEGELRTVEQIEEQIAQVRELIADGEYAEADSLARLTVASAQRSDLPRLRVARALDALVAVLIQTSNATDEEPVQLAQRAIELKEIFPPAPPGERAESRLQMSILQRQRGDYEETERLLLEALELQEQRSPPDSLDIAAIHNELGTLYTDLDDFDRAIDHFGVNLRISERLLGPNEISLARKYNHYGRMLYQNAQYEEALRALYRSLEILETNHGERYPTLGYVLNQIGAAQEELGRYEITRECYERALSIALEHYGEEHMLCASLRMNMGRLKLNTGDLAGALESLEKALPLVRATYGESHRYVGVTLGTLADTHLEMHDLDNAEAYSLAAIEAFEKTLDPEHGDIVRRWKTLGRIYREMGRLEEALEWNRRTLAHRVEAHGEESLYAAWARHELGITLTRMGDCEEAAEQLEQAREIFRSTLGAEHPSYAEACADLALVRFAEGDLEQSASLALEAEEIRRKHDQEVFRSLPEREALAFAARRRAPNEDLLCSLARVMDDPSPTWDALLRSRAEVLDAMAARQRALHRPYTDEQAVLAELYARAAERYSRILVSGPLAEPERWTEIQRQALRERDEAERALARATTGEERVAKGGLVEIRAALPGRSALVGYFRFQPVAERCERKDPEEWTPPHYLAFVLAGGTEAVQVVDLGETRELDGLIRSWMDEARAGHPEDAAAESAYRAAASALRARIWDPIAACAPEVRRFFLSPAGELHRVHFAALSVDEDEYLLDRGLVFQDLSRELDLLEDTHDLETKGTLLAFGEPNYDAVPAVEEPEDAFRGGMSECPDFQAIRFAPLPATGEEIDEISRLWRDAARGPAEELRGAAASEAALKAEARGCEILHLATHGFVIDENCGSMPGARGFEATVYTEDTPPPRPQNPLQLSGLALAGANLRADAPASREDGIVTAQEIATLDLGGVDWAVLSACDTGGGEVHSGEGVFGLRRAFEIAGAETVILSLWPVRDEIAREWMTELYRRRLDEGASTIDSVNAASAALLARRRAEGSSTHPALWGAFVACGDWR